MRLIFFIFFLCSTISIETVAAPSGYEIKVKIEGLKSKDKLKLGYHFGTKQFLKDSTEVDNKGLAIFKGDEPLDGGIYFIILPDNQGFFEFLMHEQHFSMETTKMDLVGDMKVKGSKENELFFDNMLWNKKQNEKIKVLNDKKAKATSDKDKKKIEDDIEKLSNEAKQRYTYFNQNYPESFFTKVISASSDVILPEEIKDNRTKSLAYYKENFFNNIDFSDSRLARTGIIPQKLLYYTSKIVQQEPDTVINACEKIINLAKADTNHYKIALTNLLNNFAKPKIMGMDKVYVHLVDNYYNEEDAWWVKPADLFRLQDRAKRIKPTLLGQKAKDFRLQDNEGNYHRLYDVKTKYTVLYFFDPNCGHCKKTTPKLVDFQKDNTDLDVTVFTVNTANEEEKWKKYIEKTEGLDKITNLADMNYRSNFRMNFDITGTPRIFVLDKEKKIIAKKIQPKQIRPIIDRHEKNKQ